MGYGVADHDDLRIRGDVPFPVEDPGMPLGPVVEGEVPALPQGLEDVRQSGSRAEGVVDRLQRACRVGLGSIDRDEKALSLARLSGDYLDREVGLPLDDVPYSLRRPVNRLDRHIVESDGLLHRHRLEMEIGASAGSDLHPADFVVERQIESELVAVFG